MLPSDTPAASSQARAVLQVLLVIVGIALSLWALAKLATVILVLIAAAVFAYVIAPLVQLAEHPLRVAGRSHRLSRGLAIALVYLLLAVSVSGGAALLLPSATEQVDEMIAQVPSYAQSFVTWKHGWSRYYGRLRMPLELRQSIDQSLLTAGEAIVDSGRRSLVAFVGNLSNLPWLLLIPVLAFFLLKDATSIRRTIVTTLPHRIQLRGHRLFEELNATLAAYIRAQLLACVLVGSLCGLGFAVLGISYPVLLGVLAGVLEFIPLVGPFLLAVVAATVGALHAPVLAYGALGFLAVLRVAEDYVIYPRLIRHGLQLHPFAVIVAVLIGGELAGVAGIFLAVPTMAIASVVYRHCLDWRRDDEVVGDALVSTPA